MLARAPAGSLYARIAGDIAQRIGDGSLGPGDLVPTEAALCRQYGVSRITVRRAMVDLVAQGLLTRRRGIGTFVATRPADRRTFRLVGFLDDLLTPPRRLSFAVLRNHAEPAGPGVAAALGLEEDAPVRHIRSVVMHDDEPFTVADAYTPDVGEDGVSEADFAGRLPPAHAMGSRLGQRIARAEQTLDAVAADAVVARHLAVRRGTPMIRARRTYFTADDRPFQHFVVRYHPDRYRFVVDLLARGGGSVFAATPQRDP